MMNAGTRKLGKMFSGQTSIGALVTPFEINSGNPPEDSPELAMATAKSNSPKKLNHKKPEVVM